MMMAGVSSWGPRDIDAVAAAGVVTQIFPNAIPTTVSTAAAYPPAGGGDVRRATEGYLFKLHVVPDGTNGGTIEIWDVAGLDRGASNNVNDGATMTDAYVQANGRMIDKIRITGTTTADTELSLNFNGIQFNKGLAIRFTNAGVAGKITVTPFVASGFMVQYIAG